MEGDVVNRSAKDAYLKGVIHALAWVQSLGRGTDVLRLADPYIKKLDSLE